MILASASGGRIPAAGGTQRPTVLDGTPPPGVAEWLSDILANPAGIVLSLQVMGS